MKDYSSNLSQGERLEFAANPIVIPADSIGEDERRVVTLSTPPDGFRMPSMSKVRQHDAHLSAYGSSVNVSDDASEDEETSEDDTLREFARVKRMDGMRDHSFRLPSQRGMREAFTEAYSYGYAND